MRKPRNRALPAGRDKRQLRRLWERFEHLPMSAYASPPASGSLSALIERLADHYAAMDRQEIVDWLTEHGHDVPAFLEKIRETVRRAQAERGL